jgi:cytochrome c biogenesis protein ResB
LNFLNRFFKTITRPRFVITLIVLTFIAALLGAFIPQVSDKSPSYFEEWKLKSPKTFYIVNLLQLNRVYTSVWFLSLVFIIMLSLGYSLYSQVRRNLKRKDFTPPAAADWDSIDAKTVIEQESLMRFMRKKRYKLVHDKKMSLRGAERRSNLNGEIATPFGLAMTDSERILVFSKNSINRWGGVIFHSGLFLIIIAAIIGLAFQKRGFVQVMEGEVFSGMHEDFLVKDLGALQQRFDVGFKTQLLRFHHEYWETGQIKDISSLVVIIDKDVKTKEKTINVNSPLKYNGINIYQSFDYGYALTFVLKRPDGSETVTHFLLDRPDRRTKPFVGKTDFPRTPYIFRMKFYPDISMNSFYLGKPILYLQVLKGMNNPVFEGLVIPGNVMNIEGNLVRFHGISHWSGLIYTKSPDMTPAYAGFFISCIGASIIFLLPYKEIFMSHKGYMLSLYGRTNRYKPLFEEEMKEIKKEIKEKYEIASLRSQ